MIVKSLHIYPVKSLRGIDVETVEVRPRGLACDRRFMLVRADGGFITQRQIPKLAQIKTRLSDGCITLDIPDAGLLELDLGDKGKPSNVTLWRDSFKAPEVAAKASAALSNFLSETVKLVHMDEATVRQANPKWAGGAYPVSFADGYPVLVTTTASLNALNALITRDGGTALPMTRFRPNIVVESDEPWAENNWRSLRIGEVELKLVKPCTRCIVTSIDQQTGQPGPKSALAALKTLNPSQDPKNPGVIFGQNAVVIKPGHIQRGDIIQIKGMYND